jgi:peroxiredoxin
VQKNYDDIRRLGGEVLVISSGSPKALTAYRTVRPWPFPVVTDPSLDSYHRFGLQRATWWAILNPLVLARYVRLMFRGWLPQRPYDREDLLQLGGDFVLDPRGRLVYAYPSREPTDRPPAKALVEAVRLASGKVGDG